MLVKEPETIAWIQGFSPSDLLLDVGANVGTYSMFAAARGHRVVAVEPEASNYCLLNRNIALNDFDSIVEAYCVGLGASEGYFRLHLSTTQAGNSMHQLGAPLDFEGSPFKPAFRQGAFGTTLDSFVQSVGVVPDHIKIDVDGLEAMVLAGGRRVLASGQVKSILVELNDSRADHREAMEILRRFGYSPVSRSSVSLEGRFAACSNYIWALRRTGLCSESHLPRNREQHECGSE
jgi:FkbM family methyltransferase